MKSAILTGLAVTLLAAGCGKKDQECAQIKPIVADRLAKIDSVQSLGTDPAKLAAMTDAIQAYADGAKTAKNALEGMKVSTMTLKRPVFDYTGVAFDVAMMLDTTASDYRALIKKNAGTGEVADKIKNSQKYIQEYTAKEKASLQPLAAACGA